PGIGHGPVTNCADCFTQDCRAHLDLISFFALGPHPQRLPPLAYARGGVPPRLSAQSTLYRAPPTARAAARLRSRRCSATTLRPVNAIAGPTYSACRRSLTLAAVFRDDLVSALCPPRMITRRCQSEHYAQFVQTLQLIGHLWPKYPINHAM